MPDISSCYFCSSLAETTEYPLIPERLEPSADEQRTIVVCEDCRDKLDRIFEPVTRYVESSDQDEKRSVEQQEDAPENSRRATPDEQQTSTETDDKASFPDGTKQIVRLLQNRELPADRNEIELLASNAYDIDRTKCEKILDALIAHEYFIEVDGEIRSGIRSDDKAAFQLQSALLT